MIHWPRLQMKSISRMTTFESNLSLSRTLLVGISILLAGGCSLILSNGKDDCPFGWAQTPSLKFVSADWEWEVEEISAGDSLSIGFVDLIRPEDYIHTRVLTATVVSASQDTEIVNIFERPLPGFWENILTATGVKLATVSQQTYNVRDAVLSVMAGDIISITYVQPLHTDNESCLELHDAVRVKEPQTRR